MGMDAHKHSSRLYSTPRFHILSVMDLVFLWVHPRTETSPLSPNKKGNTQAWYHCRWGGL